MVGGVGARAHYIRRSEGAWQLRYSQWGAETIDRDIFWGPDHTRAFIDAQVARGPDDWMEECWCEGAVLMDEDRRELWYFGGTAVGDILGDRVYGQLLRTPWAGWRLRPSTLPDIAQELGVDRGPIETTYEPEPLADDWRLVPGRNAWMVVTLARAGRVDAFAVDELPASVIALGPDRLLAAGAGTTVAIDLPGCGGLHVDADRRTVHWWPGSPHELAHLFASAWPGWAHEPLGDRFEAHVELARGAFTVDAPPRDEIVAHIRGHLLSESATDPADIRARFEAKYGEVAFATHFDTPVPVRLSPEDRTRIVDAAIAALPPD